MPTQTQATHHEGLSSVPHLSTSKFPTCQQPSWVVYFQVCERLQRGAAGAVVANARTGRTVTHQPGHVCIRMLQFQVLLHWQLEGRQGARTKAVFGSSLACPPVKRAQLSCIHAHAHSQPFKPSVSSTSADNAAGRNWFHQTNAETAWLCLCDRCLTSAQTGPWHSQPFTKSIISQ